MKELTRVIIAVILTALIIVIVPIPLIMFICPVIVYRWLMSNLYKCFSDHRISAGIIPLGSILFCPLVKKSSHWVHSNEKKHSILLTFKIEGSSLDIDSFRALVTRELIAARKHGDGRLLYPEFQQYPDLWMAYLFWKQDSFFSIENHIKMYENNDDWNIRDAQFCKNFVCAYGETTLPHDRSPWEVIVVENVRETPNSDPTSLIVFKFAHYLADGHAIFAAITRLADGGPENVQRPEAKPWTKWQLFVANLLLPVKATYEFMSEILVRDAPSECIWNRGAIGGKLPTLYPVLSSQVEFDALKTIAKRSEVTVSGLLLLSIGRATGKYLVEQATYKHEEIPSHVKCMIALPSPRHAKGLTNEMYFGILNVPTQVAFDKQLDEFKRNLMSGKQLTFLASRKLVLLIVGLLPATWMWKYTLVRLSLIVDHMLSVFPGPKKEFKIMGKRVVGMNYINIGGLDIFPSKLTILTYNGMLQFWLAAKSSEDNVTYLAKCLEQEFTAPDGEQV